jgi:hypothetical protein
MTPYHAVETELEVDVEVQVLFGLVVSNFWLYTPLSVLVLNINLCVFKYLCIAHTFSSCPYTIQDQQFSKYNTYVHLESTFY